METIATHPGVVVHSADGHVQVKMEVISACGSCEAHAHCTFSEKKDKLVDIDTPHWEDYQPDDRVTVIINSGRGLQAVLIAYVLPALVMLAAFSVLYILKLPELWIALITILVVCIYGWVLYLMRHRLQRKFTFRIEKQ
ncbi:MAG: SoxR reducing system RseC family protein [Bacteroidales bacterium]|nr:SoxR reducing system RseC family protein [Bacteroidales bacterium]